VTDVLFPTMSHDNPSAVGILATWFARDGEPVSEGQLVAEVQMDKVDAEVLAPAGGTLRLVTAEGSEVEQGSVIATIE
jgi:pyruvate/2-oxoglutarate dehydrogenase complex dihydrolipoamide acyltransferase (E2) component